VRAVADVLVGLILSCVTAQFVTYFVLRTARTIRGYLRDYRRDRDIGSFRDFDAEPAPPPNMTVHR
jgi:hypothetical protein